MGTITDKLNAILNSKNAIKNALIAKGVDIINSTPFSEYSDKIGNIKLNINDPAVSLFYTTDLSPDYVPKVEDFIGWDTVTNLSSKLSYSNLETFICDLPELTTAVTLLAECQKLKNVNIYTPKCLNFLGAFSSTAVESVTIRGCKPTNINSFLYNCNNIDIDNLNIDFTEVIEAESAFSNSSITRVLDSHSKIQNAEDMYNRCISISGKVELIFPEGINLKSVLRACNVDTITEVIINAPKCTEIDMYAIPGSSSKSIPKITLILPSLTRSNLFNSGYINATDLTIDISSFTQNIKLRDASNVTNLNVQGTVNCNISIISDVLTKDSCINLFNALVDLTDSDQKTVTLSATTLNSLSEEEKAIATNKNWILASA